MGQSDSEEKEILNAFEGGKVKRVKDRKKEIERHKEIAEATAKRNSRTNTRISSKDLRALQKRAFSEGIAYQTLVASVLHRYSKGQLSEQAVNNDTQRARKTRRRSRTLISRRWTRCQVKS